MADPGSAIATSALSGAAMGSVVPGIGTAVGAGVGALAGYLASRKTKGEKELEAANAAEAARIANEQARLGGGNGGMSASKLLNAQSAVRGASASAANEQIANAMRGSSADAGASGMQQAAIANAQEAEQRALSQGMSNIRQQDLDYAEAQRQALQAQKQQLFQNQITTTGYQRDRKRELANALGSAGTTAATGQIPAVPGSTQDYVTGTSLFSPDAFKKASG